MIIDEIKFQKIIQLFREQLEWEVKKGEGFYEHVRRCLEIPEQSALTPEEFVRCYRMTFKPKYPNHPTGGVGEEGDVFIFIEPKDAP